jgi:hypothetical protein
MAFVDAVRISETPQSPIVAGFVAVVVGSIAFI